MLFFSNLFHLVKLVSSLSVHIAIEPEEDDRPQCGKIYIYRLLKGEAQCNMVVQRATSICIFQCTFERIMVIVCTVALVLHGH